MRNGKMKEACEKMVKVVARKVAVMEANSACPYIGYQPVAPKEVRNLRKF